MMASKPLLCVLTTLVIAGFPSHPSAQRPSAVADLRQLDCTFSVSAAMSWDGPQPRVEIRQAQTLEFRVASIDQGRGTAEFMYGALSIPSTTLVAGSIIHFIEPPANGAVALASVTVTSRQAKRFPAAYSRTEYYAYNGTGFASSPHAEQYYGYCVPTFG
jgi:hypothetical protein